MIGTSRAPSVILITDPKCTLERTVEVIDAAGRELGARKLVVQLRDKSAPASLLEHTARTLRGATARAGALFVVNAPSREALRIAHDAGCDGVHVPCRGEAIAEAATSLGASAWISVPAHTDEDVMLAVAARATAVLVSPIFETPGKGPARGIGALVAARRLASGVPLLVYSLGGVSPATAAACAGAGADGVAVIRALLEAADPGAVARALDAPFQGRAAVTPVA